MLSISRVFHSLAPEGVPSSAEGVAILSRGAILSREGVPSLARRCCEGGGRERGCPEGGLP